MDLPTVSSHSGHRGTLPAAVVGGLPDVRRSSLQLVLQGYRTRRRALALYFMQEHHRRRLKAFLGPQYKYACSQTKHVQTELRSP